MSMIVPNEMNYTSQNAIPNGTTSTDINVPSLQQSYSLTAGGIVQFELPSKAGYIVSDTISIRYKTQIVSTGESKIKCTPLYTFFSKLQTTLGGVEAEIIPDYNIVVNTLVNSTFNVAQKNGNPSYGWRTDNDQISNLETQDSRHCEQNETFSMAGPLPNIISACTKYYPIGATGTGTKFMLTLDNISNSFCPATAAVVADAAAGVLATAALVLPTDVILSEFVLNYTMVMLPPEAENAILGNGPITLKSSSFTTSANNIALGSSGSVDLIYSHKAASVKALFLLCSSTIGANGRYDAYDICGPQGSVQFGISGKMIPTRPLDFSTGSKTMLMTSLKQAVGSIYNQDNNFSINNGEFFRTLALPGTAVSPAKCFIAVNTEILASKSNSVLLSGISTQESPITCRIVLSAATIQSVSAILISHYDVLIEIDPATKSVVVRK
jgi:hypothetical protein